MSEQFQATTTEADAPLAALNAELDQPVTQSNAVAWFALIVVFLLTAAISVGGWLLWPQWQQLHAQQVQHIRSQQDAEQQMQQLVQVATQQQTDAIAAQQQEIMRWQQQQTASQQQYTEQFMLQVHGLRQQIQQAESAPPQHWVLMEVRFLLVRASQNLVLQQDINSAIALLTAADKQLAEVNNPALLAVRQAIAADLAALNSLNLPDKHRMHLQLGQMRLQIASLPVKQQPQQLLTLPEPDAELANWRQNVAAFWHQTWSALFQVRATLPDDVISLTAEQQLSIQLSLQQQLMLAEMALLQQQPEVFNVALQRAADLLQRYFVADTPAVQQLSTHLVTLADAFANAPTIPVMQSLPQLERQLAILQEALYE